jgi:hypothetical protein
MNAGITEEVGSTARGVIDALRVQPLSIVLIILVGVIMTYVFYIQTRQLDTRDRNLQQLFESQKDILEQWRQVFNYQQDNMRSIVKDQGQLTEKMMVCITPEVLRAIDEQKARGLPLPPAQQPPFRLQSDQSVPIIPPLLPTNPESPKP